MIDTSLPDIRTNRRNTVLILYLITSLLFIQWSTAHMHLSTQHEHDGGPHHHSTEVHTQHSGSHHANQIDSSPQSSETNVVELNSEYRLTNSTKQKKRIDTLQTSAFQPPLLYLSKALLSGIISTNLGYLNQTTVYLRGPPLFS